MKMFPFIQSHVSGFEAIFIYIQLSFPTHTV